MEKAIKNIELTFNCPQNWDDMTPCSMGKYCSVCQKIVHDFTNKSQKEYAAIVEKHRGQICGKFQASQVKMPSKFAKIAAFAAFSLIATPANAQEEGRVPIPVVCPEQTPKEDTFIGIIVEQMPEFIGGQKAMFKFLSDNIHYPTNTCGIEGTVYVGFVVEIDGTLSNIAVKRGIPILNEEAIRVVKLMSGKWKCGYQSGKPMRVAYTLPLRWHLE